MKKAYLQKLEVEPDPDNITSLPHTSRGRPLILKEYDAELAKYVHSLRFAGGIVNRDCSILVDAPNGIASHSNPSLLKEQGVFHRLWA